MVMREEDFQEKYCKKCGMKCDWQWDNEEDGIGHCAKGKAQSFSPYDERY